jgi:carboxymethylenebutenolidase
MERRTAADFDPEVLILFDAYVHGAIDRRGFLDRAAKYAAGGVTAAMLLDALNPRFAEAQQVATDDTRIKTEYLEYPSPHGYGTMRGYLARPAGAAGQLPAIVVAHENRGLNPHIEDIVRRLAIDGFMAFAPDALFPLGGYPGGEDKARELFPRLDQSKTREDFVAAAHYLRTRPDATGRLGAVGFCFGGGIVNMLAARVPELSAAVPFYGGPAPIPDVPKIKSAVLLQFAEQDERINAAWPAYEAALKAAGVAYEAHVYPGTQHGFNNDTTPRYDEKAARVAWERTVAFFNKHLRT